MTDKVKVKPNTNLLRRWLRQRRLSIAQFSRDIGIRSNYIYILLGTNPKPLTYEVIGRALAVYGDEFPAKELAMAIWEQQVGKHPGATMPDLKPKGMARSK